MGQPGGRTAQFDGRAAAGRGQSVPDQSAQSTSSAVPPASSWSRAPCSKRGERRGLGRPRRPVEPVEAAPGRAARRGAARGDGRGRPVASAACGHLAERAAAGPARAPRRRPARPAGRRAAPRRGRRRRSRVLAGRRCRGRRRPAARRAAAAPPARAPAGCRRPRPRPAPRPRRARGAAPGCEVRPERTSTAISDHGDAVLEVGAAQQVGDVLGLGPGGVEGAHLHPARRRARCSTGGGARNASEHRRGRWRRACVDRARRPLREAASSRGAEPAGDLQRDDVGAAGRRTVRNVVGEVEDAAHLGPAEARRSTGRGRRPTTRLRPSPASACSSATWLGSVSWYSSTKTQRNRAPQLVADLRASRRQRRPPGDQVRGSRWRSRCRGRRGTAP